jgi:ABC-type multidrug transport system fused ATPase/permease subunit
MFKDIKQLSALLTRKEKWKFVILFCSMVIAALLEATAVGAVPGFIAFLMRPASLNEFSWLNQHLPSLPETATVPLVLWASGLLMGFIILKNLFLAGVYYLQARIVGRQQARLSDRMFRAYQTASYDWFLQRSSSELQRNIQQDTSVVLGGVVMPMLDLVLAAVMSLAVLAVMLVATPTSTLISIGIVGLGLVGLIRLARKQLEQVGKIQHRESRESIKAIQQGFGAFVDARIIGCEKYLAQVYKRSLFRQIRAGIRSMVINKINPSVIETIAIFGMLIVLLFIIQSGKTLQESLPTLSVIAVIMMRLKRIASQVAGNINRINQSRPYIPGLIKDLHELHAMERQRSQKFVQAGTISDFQQLNIESIQYTYPNTERPALNGISLQLQKGESIAFVGSTGCGKSTLVNCILGLLHPQAGQIQVNGTDIHADPCGWRASLGYIPQSIFLIDDSLRANIAFGVPLKEIDPARIESALRSAALSEFVHSLEKGLDTLIGERGVRLSGGQRQRLGIARALYFNPQVLVMDEATSALDNQTETEVMQAIQNLKKDRTLIMIAHRLSTVEECDRLYFLDNGKIADVGSYRELIQQSAQFRAMATI